MPEVPETQKVHRGRQTKEETKGGGFATRFKPRSSQKTAPVQLSKILEPPLPNPTPVAKSRMPESRRNAGSPQSPGRARGLGAILGYREITIFGGELAAWAR